MKNDVSKVMVSAASRRDAREVVDNESLMAAILEIKEERRQHGLRTQQIQSELITIASRIRGNRLQNEEYHNLCRKQAELQVEKISLIEKMSEKKRRLYLLEKDRLLLDPGPAHVHREVAVLSDIRSILIENQKPSKNKQNMITKSQRYTVSITSGLLHKMKAVGRAINWSHVAREAFTRKLDELAGKATELDELRAKVAKLEIARLTGSSRVS